MGVAGAAVIEINLLLAALRTGVDALLLVAAVVAAVAGAVFAALAVRQGHRWRPWMTHGSMVVGEGNLAFLVVISDDPATAIGLASSFTLAAVFAGLYLPGRPVVLHIVGLAALGVGSVVVAAGARTGLSAALTIVPVSVLLAFLSHRLATLLRQKSELDPLTGLVNRRGLWRIAGELSRARVPATWSVVVLDMDGFKQVNDVFGHEFGDSLLEQAARGWSRTIPRRGVLARTGGDEFVVLVPATRAATLELVGELRRLTPAEVGLSAGAACWDLTMPLDASLRHADEALYRAKRGGRGITVEHGVDAVG